MTVDTPIQTLLALFGRKLWTDNEKTDFVGRVYDNEKYGDNKALLGINPEEFESGKRYKEKLLSSKLDATVFFRVTDRDPVELMADVSIYFSVNLAKLYPDETGRADELAIRDVKKVLDYSNFRIKSNGIISGKSAFDDYFGVSQNKHDMQPYFLFRIDTTVSYCYSTCTTTTPTTYALTTSAGTGGSVIPEYTSESFTKDTNVPIAAVADTGYRFLNWVINTISNSNNPTIVKMNRTISAVCYFIAQWDLTASVDGEGTISPASGTYDDGDIVSIVAEPTDPETTELSSIKVNDIEVSTTSPYSLLMDAGKSVIAYFTALIDLFYQKVFTGDDTEIITIDNLHYYDNSGTGDANLQIKDTMILTIEAGVYMTFINLNGATIISSGGTSTPTKISDQRIDFTEGSVWDILLSDGTLLNCCDGQGVSIKDQSGNGNDGTLIGANQAVSWGTRNDAAYPKALEVGGNKYKVCVTDGTTVHVADPYGDNTLPEEDVESISAYGERIFSIKKILYSHLIRIAFVSEGTSYSSLNGLDLSVSQLQSIRIGRRINGSLTLLAESKDYYISNNIQYYYKIQYNSYENEFFTSPANWIRVLIKGGDFIDWTVMDTTDGNGTNPCYDDTYALTKYVVIESDSGDMVSYASKDGVKYDVDHFVDDTGTYATRLSVGIGTTDADGNELEYPANSCWNTGNTFQNVDDVTLNAIFDANTALGVLKYPNIITHDELNSIDVTGISEDDFQITNGQDDRIVKNMIVAKQ